MFLYDSLGRNHIRINPNGTSDQMQFDNRDRLTAIDLYNSGGSFLRRQSYTYDAASQMLTHTTDGVTTTYTYDPVGQLLSEARPGYTGAYTYDGNGNRLTRTVNGVAETYAYDSGDKLQSVSVGGTAIKTYGYDAAGRTTSVTSSAGITTLTYDFESRITQISGPGINATYSYNGLDTRVGKTENSVANTFRRSGAYVTDPVLSDGTASYTPGVSVRSGGNVRYQHTGLKNTDSQTSPAQSVAASRIYDAFGNFVSSSGTWTGPFGYAGNFGYQQDASGLKLLGHRYYDPSTGRFLTRDPIKDGRNWYAYGSGQSAPTAIADPSGLVPLALLAPVLKPLLKKLAKEAGREAVERIIEALIEQAWAMFDRLVAQGVSGQRAHQMVADWLKREAAKHNLSDLIHVEQKYKDGRPYNGATNEGGWVRPDIVLGPKNAPFAIIDWKSGRGMTNDQEARYRRHVFGSRVAPIIVVSSGKAGGKRGRPSAQTHWF